MVIIKLRGVFLHYLLRILQSVLAMQLGAMGVGLLVGVIVDEEIFDGSVTCSRLVHSKAGGKLLVCAYLNGVEH